MTRTRILVTALIAGLAAAVPAAPAGAATQGFAGLLERGSIVRFTGQAPASLTRPLQPRGLAAGERLVALAARDGVVYGLGSAARLYRIDLRDGRARSATGGRNLLEGLRGTRFSLAITPDGSRARILSDVGQDVFVDLRTGAPLPGPGLRLADGTAVRPAVTMAPDGRLVGLDLGRNLVVREAEPDSGMLIAIPLRGLRRIDPGRFGEPTSFALGQDGRGYATATLLDRGRVRQSLSFVVDISTGEASRRLDFFLRRVDALAAVRSVPEDRAAPRARITVPKQLSARDILNGRTLRVRVAMPEAGQVLTSIRTYERAGARRIGFSLRTVDMPTAIRRHEFFVNGRERAILRRSIGKRIAVAITTNDFAGNGRVVLRTTRLVR